MNAKSASDLANFWQFVTRFCSPRVFIIKLAAFRYTIIPMTKRFVKLLISFSFLLIFAVGSAGQEMCQMELKDAPALFNLKLGMSPEQAQAAVGKALSIKIKKNGEHTFFQNFIEKDAPPSLGGVRAVYLRFFDRQLYQIEFFYAGENTRQTTKGFINLQPAKFNLPAPAWKIEYGIAEINCGAFSVVADNVLNPRIEITDEIVRTKVEELRKQQKD